jgi:hypothetical protein
MTCRGAHSTPCYAAGPVDLRSAGRPPPQIQVVSSKAEVRECPLTTNKLTKETRNVNAPLPFTIPLQPILGRQPPGRKFQKKQFRLATTFEPCTSVYGSVLQLNGSWLQVSAALRPSSGQLVQIKCPQCAYNMGSLSVYNRDICEKKTTVKKRILEGKICYTLIQITLKY